MHSQTLNRLAKAVCHELSARALTVSSAESCTGGLIAKLLTDIPGSSSVFSGACVTYTNDMKISLLGVDPAIIEAHTEVSRDCAKAMAEGARKRMGTSLAVSTTGYAGPGGGSELDPVGTVYIALSDSKHTSVERFCAPNGATRAQVRQLAAARALQMILEEIAR
jgi:PncC family amidohydrolase